MHNAKETDRKVFYLVKMIKLRSSLHPYLILKFTEQPKKNQVTKKALYHQKNQRINKKKTETNLQHLSSNIP